MAYKVRIDTSKYKDRRCSQKNWEPGTMNDFMHAINGWSIRENNLQELKWRINYIGGCGSCGVNEETWGAYQAWVEKHEKKNYIEFMDVLCEFKRKEKVKVYGFAQGYFNVDKIIDELKKNGSVRIPFSRFYDTRQYIKNMDGCFIEILKV